MSKKDDIFNYNLNPWASPEEFIEFYELLFQNDKPSKSVSKSINNLDSFIESLSLDNLKKSMIYLIKWDSRGDNKIFYLPIMLLVNTIIKIKENKINNKDINSNHILAEIIIRVINIIMDQLRKTKKVNSLNMYLIAKSLELPEFIIDIRHACTHKNLSNYNELVFAVKYLFYWIKIKLIEPKYISFIKKKKYFLFILNQLNNDEEKFNLKNNIEFNDSIKLEPEYLMIIITQLFVNIKKFFIYNKSKTSLSYNNNKIKPKIQIFIKILENEKEIFLLMIFSFIYQQINKINSNKKISQNEKNEYKQYLIYFIKILYNNIDKNIKFDLKNFEIFYLSLYQKMNQIKDEYKLIYEIFINIFKNSIKNINLENQNELNDYDLYANLDKIEGNINTINIEKLNKIFDDNIINIDNEKEKKENQMLIEDKEINGFLGKDIRDDYKNSNSIIL